MQFITYFDYLLLPAYLIVIYLIAFNVRNRFYPEGHPWRPYFMPGLNIKIIGAIAIGMIYQYNYGGGDTANYFQHATVINGAFTENTIKWFNLVLHTPAWYDGEYAYYINQMQWYQSPPEYLVCSITAFISLFTFTTYLPTSVIFAALSYTGIWALFRAFVGQYPSLIRPIAIVTLFIPSLALWGSGIFKDTICLGGIGWLTYGVFRILYQRDFSIQNVIATLVSFYLIFIIKVYILIAFVPALALWIMFQYLQGISSSGLRFVVRIVAVVIMFAGFSVLSVKLADKLGKYSIDNVAQTSEVTRDWINSVSLANEESSGYDLGAFEPNLQGMLTKFIPAVNVTLFRPYIWETKKVIQLLSSLEALAFLLLTIKVLIAVGPVRVWRSIAADPNIQFCLIFTLIFAFAVGVSSFNFGALSRYRIPCLPFYGLALMLIYYRWNSAEKNILSFRL
jgi:hypothetical protein